MTSLNQMQKEILTKKAPKSLERVDKPNFPFEQPHVHFNDAEKSALNIDGTWKHGGKILTNIEKKWLKSHGWEV